MQTKLRGQTVLMVVSILLIIGCAINIIASALGIVGGGLLMANGGEAGQIIGGLAIASLIITLLLGVYQLITAICGIRFRKRAEKAGACFVLGIILLIIGIAVVAINYFITGEISWVSAVTTLILPALYIVGAALNKTGDNEIHQ